MPRSCAILVFSAVSSGAFRCMFVPVLVFLYHSLQVYLEIHRQTKHVSSCHNSILVLINKNEKMQFIKSNWFKTSFWAVSRTYTKEMSEIEIHVSAIYACQFLPKSLISKILSVILPFTKNLIQTACTGGSWIHLRSILRGYNNALA